MNAFPSKRRARPRPYSGGAAVNGVFLDRRWWVGMTVACLVAAVAALVVPVSLPEGSRAADSLTGLPEHAGGSAPEDLGAFLDSRRWGASLREILEAEAERARQAREAEQPESTINPVLAKMGFVGLIVTAGRSEVLLAAPEGGVARYAPGDALPDGRALVSVTDNSLTLKGDDTPRKCSRCFPDFGRSRPPATTLRRRAARAAARTQPPARTRSLYGVAVGVMGTDDNDRHSWSPPFPSEDI